jgi:ribosomal-protein-alanine N-acetyltransferase
MKETLAAYSLNFPVLETERLRLRAFQASDEKMVFSLFSDPEVMRFYNSEPIQTVAEAGTLIANFGSKLRDGEGIRWAIEEKAGSSYIGSIGFIRRADHPFTAGLGYELGKKSGGNGYVAEAIRPLVPFGFSSLWLERIEALVVDGNAASCRVLEKCKSRYEGLLRKKGGWKNSSWYLHFYSITKDDIPAT